METIYYITSLLTFYLKGEISATENFLKFKKPNTILSFIPLGAKKESIPVNQLSMVSSDFKLNLKGFIWGFIVFIIGFSVFGQDDGAFGGLLILAIGLNKMMSAFETVISIQTTSGAVKTVPFFVFEKAKAEDAVEKINKIIANRLDDTNNRKNTDRIVDAINKKDKKED